MRTYYDTGALIPLYVEEAWSAKLTAHVVAAGEPIPISLFHEMEIENALRLKAFRREITPSQFPEVLRKIAQHVEDGRLIRQPVVWAKAMEEARRVSALATARSGCRTLDVLHIGLALHWGCPLFASLDDRQLRAASMTPLKVLDIRKL